MNVKMLGTVVLLGFVAISVGYLIVSESGAPAGGEGVSERRKESGAEGSAETRPATRPVAQSHKVIAYYFHNTHRCMTCNKIERLAKETLDERFATAMEDGRLEWQTLNMEEPLNAGYVQDYKLVTASLVLADMHGGEERDWTNLDKVWQYVHGDEAEFKEYVAKQLRAYLES